MKTNGTKTGQPGHSLFSMDQLNGIGDNDDAFTRQMLIKFAHQVSMCSGKIKDAVMRNDWMNLKTITHKNIPAYSIMNSEEALELLKYIENNAEKVEEQARVKNMAALVCKKNDSILVALIDHLQVGKRHKMMNHYQYTET